MKMSIQDERDMYEACRALQAWFDSQELNHADAVALVCMYLGVLLRALPIEAANKILADCNVALTDYAFIR